jgi:hypothetical protein
MIRESGERMISLFRRRTQQLPSTPSPIRMKKFTRQGDSPFKKLSFVTHQVFQLQDYSLRTDEEKMEFFEAFISLPYSFEYWIIPSVFNVGRLVKNMEQEVEEEGTKEFVTLLQQTMKNMNSFRINRQFLVVNRQDSRHLIAKVKEFGLSFHEIPEMVANVVKVKYEVAGEEYEKLSV